MKLLTTSLAVLCFFLTTATANTDLKGLRISSLHNRSLSKEPLPISKHEKIDNLICSLELILLSCNNKMAQKEMQDLIEYLTSIKQLIHEDESWEENRDRLAPIIKHFEPIMLKFDESR